MIYEPGNAAKQWILEEIDRRFGQRPAQILDLACGNGRIWKRFLETHPAIKVVGVDYDSRAIEQGRSAYANNHQMDLRVFDAQKSLDEIFDMVVAMSAIEHVVDRPAFLRTVWLALKPQALAYLNYDSGHFCSRNLKARAMVPISQILAFFGWQKWYMKRVDDPAFLAQAEAQGFKILEIKKHNLCPLKGFMRGASEEAVVDWVEFEKKLNDRFSVEQLDKVMWSTTAVVQKP